MGQSTSIYNKQGGFNIYHYPFSVRQKVLQFPYKFAMHYSNTAPFVLIFWAWTTPMFIYLNSVLGSKEVKKLYREHHQHQRDYPHYHWSVKPLRPDYDAIDLEKVKHVRRWRQDSESTSI